MRPKTVDWFEYLMITTLVIGVVRMVIDRQALPPALRTDGVLIFQAGIILLILVMVLLISRKRSNIVRWIMLFMVLVGTLMYLPMLSGMIDQRADWLSISLATIQLVFQLVAVYLVFRPESKPWFSKRAKEDYEAWSRNARPR